MPTSVNREEVQHLTQSGAQLIEVLPEEEYQEWHLPGALNIPLKDFTLERIAQLDRNAPVVLYCANDQ